MNARAVLLVVGAGLGCCGWGCAQAGGQPTLLPRAAGEPTRTLEVVVEGTAPLPAVGQLVVRVDGVSVPVEAAAPGGTSLLLVLDAVNSSAEELARGEGGLQSYLGGGSLRVPVPTTVLVVSVEQGRARQADGGTIRTGGLVVHRLSGQTGPVLRDELKRYAAGVMAGSGVDGAERVRLSLEAMSVIARAEEPVAGAKVAVWISPGWPYLREGAGAGASGQVFSSVVYFSDLLQTARMVVSVVDPLGVTAGSGGGMNEGFLLSTRQGSIQAAGHAPEIPEGQGDEFFRSYVRSPATARDASPNQLSLEALAVRSGGQVVQHQNRLAAGIARCAADAERLISVTVPAMAGGDRLHRVAVSSGERVGLWVWDGFYGR